MCSIPDKTHPNTYLYPSVRRETHPGTILPISSTLVCGRLNTRVFFGIATLLLPFGLCFTCAQRRVRWWRVEAPPGPGDDDGRGRAPVRSASSAGHPAGSGRPAPGT